MLNWKKIHPETGKFKPWKVFPVQSVGDEGILTMKVSCKKIKA